MMASSTLGVGVGAASTRESLLATLTALRSQNDRELRVAEEQLKLWETSPGFYAALVDIVLNSESIPMEVRWHAVLYFKNGIDKYWRKTAPNALSEEEKTHIRGQLLRSFSEPAQPIALQIAVLMGKAARLDVPKDWPELIPSLLESVQSHTDIIQHRSLMVMHHVIKSLGSKRLAADRRIFHDMIRQLLPYVIQIWQTHHSIFMQQTSQQQIQSMSISLEKATLSLKVLRKSIVHGLKVPHENVDAMRFLNMVPPLVGDVLKLRNDYPQLREALEKYLVLFLKLLSDLLDNHPFSFLPVLKSSLDLICFSCFTAEGQKLVFQRFSIFALNLLKQTLLCVEYKPPKNPDHEQAKESVHSLTNEGHSIKSSFFSEAIVKRICECLISHYLPLTEDDLALWDADGEEYVCEDGGDSWKYSFRPCCETLFLSLIHEFKTMLVPCLVSLVHQNSLPVPSTDLNAILYKDAVYNAAGLTAFDLFDEIDFDRWLVSGLEPELAIKDSNYRIIRRRAVWLLGQWSGVKLSPQLRPKLYQIIIPLLHGQEDLVVRITAAKSLKVVIDDFEFCSEEFEPFLGTSFGQLFQLLGEVKECDTKLSVLNVLSYIIERMGVSIRPLCSELVQYLPALWDASNDHNMLRCSILTTLVFIVQGLGTISEGLAPFLYPVIRLSTDLKDPCSVYLLEDGLELWLTVLHNTKQMNPSLYELSANISPLLELGSENLRTMIYILQAYILLSPHDFLTNRGQQIGKTLEDMVTDLLDEGVLMVLRLTELELKVGPSPAPFKGLICLSLRSIYEGDDFPMVMSLHLSIASRLLISYPTEFNQYSIEVAQILQKPHHEVAGRILDVWLDKMLQVTQPDRKKLLSLALSSLLTSGSPVVLDRIFAIILNVTETLGDITRQDEQIGGHIDALIKSPADLAAEGDDLDYETEHDQRKRDVAAQDPVHTIILRDYLQTQIQSFKNQIGETRYEDIMTNVDVETMANLKEFVVL